MWKATAYSFFPSKPDRKMCAAEKQKFRSRFGKTTRPFVTRTTVHGQQPPFKRATVSAESPCLQHGLEVRITALFPLFQRSPNAISDYTGGIKMVVGQGSCILTCSGLPLCKSNALGEGEVAAYSYCEAPLSPRLPARSLPECNSLMTSGKMDG